MEGLEISEVLLSEVAHGNDVLRCDAEYFGKVALSTINRLQSIKSISLNHMAFITDGIHTSLPFIADGDIKVLSAKHPKDNFIDLSQFETISAVYHDLNPRTALRENDVLISTVGTIGNAAVVTSDILPANSDRHIGIIRLRSNGPTPFYLSTFLVSRYGRLQSVRETTGNVQPNLFISKIGKLLIPRFSNNFENTITAQIQRAYKKRKQASEFLWQAEQTLLNALGLENWQAPEPLSYVRGSRDVFSAGRLDAEHFQPKYEEAQKVVLKTGIKLTELRSIIQPVQNGLDIRDYFESGTPYIRVGDIKNGQIDLDSAAKVRVNKSDIKKNVDLKVGDVLFTRKGSFGNAAPVRKEHEHAIISSEIMLLRINDTWKKTINPEYLALFFNCMFGKLQAEKWAHGVAFFSVTQDDLERFLVPVLDVDKQKTIQEKIRQSELAKQHASQHLDAAKRAVEIAIEENEDAAMTYLSAARQKADENPKEYRI